MFIKIVMMNSIDSTKSQWSKILIITPAIAIFTIISCAKMNVINLAEEDRGAIAALQNKLESGEKILSYGGEEKNARNILYIIDGQKYSAESIDIRSMNTEDIESLTVLSGKSAATHYGEDAKSGVIIIKTKSSSATAMKLPDETTLAEKPEVITSTAIRINSSYNNPLNPENNIVGLPVRIFTPEETGKSAGILTIKGDKQPLCIVNGEKQLISNINPNSIKNITVLKGESAIALYGEEARNGVVIIELK